jgi:hypothetical protein
LGTIKVDLVGGDLLSEQRAIGLDHAHLNVRKVGHEAAESRGQRAAREGRHETEAQVPADPARDRLHLDVGGAYLAEDVDGSLVEPLAGIGWDQAFGGALSSGTFLGSL